MREALDGSNLDADIRIAVQQRNVRDHVVEFAVEGRISRLVHEAERVLVTWGVSTFPVVSSPVFCAFNSL
jgi:hypothetical protein